MYNRKRFVKITLTHKFFWYRRRFTLSEHKTPNGEKQMSAFCYELKTVVCIIWNWYICKRIEPTDGVKTVFNIKCHLSLLFMHTPKCYFPVLYLYKLINWILNSSSIDLTIFGKKLHWNGLADNIDKRIIYNLYNILFIILFRRFLLGDKCSMPRDSAIKKDFLSNFMSNKMVIVVKKKKSCEISWFRY